MGLDYDLFIAKIFSDADKKSIPLSGAFELTSRCPFDCKMCYVHRKENNCEAIKQEKSTEWWINLTDEAKKRRYVHASADRRRASSRSDFEEIYLHAKKSGVLVSVNTNGLLINDEKIKFFTDNPPQKLNITLCGAPSQ